MGVFTKDCGRKDRREPDNSSSVEPAYAGHPSTWTGAEGAKDKFRVPGRDLMKTGGQERKHLKPAEEDETT